MTDHDKETLAALERLLAAGSPPAEILKAAYLLGDFNGKLAMARVGQQKVAA